MTSWQTVLAVRALNSPLKGTWFHAQCPPSTRGRPWNKMSSICPLMTFLNSLGH